MLLGVSYRQGEGVPHSDEEALKYFKLAAEQGNEQAQELLELTEKNVKFTTEFPKLKAEYEELEDRMEHCTNFNEKCEILDKMKENRRKIAELTGESLEDEAEKTNTEGSGSGCMVLLALMLAPVIAAGGYCVYSLLS